MQNGHPMITSGPMIVENSLHLTPTLPNPFVWLFLSTKIKLNKTNPFIERNLPRLCPQRKYILNIKNLLLTKLENQYNKELNFIK